MSGGSSWTRPVASAQEQSARNALHLKSVEELQRLSLLPGGFGRARGQAWPYLLGVPLTDDIATYTERLPFRDQTAISHLNSQTQSHDSAALTGSEEILSSCLHGLSSETLSSPPNFSGGDDFSPHPDEHQVQLDTNRSFVLYPIIDSSVNQRKHLQADLHQVILGVLRRRPALRYFQGYHDIVTVLLLTLPVDLVIPCVEKLSLHRLRDSMGNGLEPLVGQLRILKRLLRMVDPPYAEILERNSPLPYYALSNLLTLFAHDMPTLPLIQHVFDWLLCREPVASIWLTAALILNRKEDVLALDRESEDAMGMVHAVLSSLPPLCEDDLSFQLPNSMNATHCSTENDGSSGSSAFSSMVAEEPMTEPQVTVVGSPGQDMASLELSQSSELMMDSWSLNSSQVSSPRATSITESQADISSGEANTTATDTSEEANLDLSEQTHPPLPSHPHSHSPSSSPSFPGEYMSYPSSPPLPLSTLLCRASDLLSAYPPSSPALRLAETFGSHSALRIDNLLLPNVFPILSNDVAESYVGGDDVVLPLNPEEEEEELLPPKSSKKHDSHLEQLRNGRSIQITNALAVRRQTVFAGVVLFVGVAVALYEFSPGGKSGRNGGAKIGIGNMRYIAAWIGGLLGVGERLGIGL